MKSHACCNPAIQAATWTGMVACSAQVEKEVAVQTNFLALDTAAGGATPALGACIQYNS